jgi:hypothetical protein
LFFSIVRILNGGLRLWRHRAQLVLADKWR